MKGHIARKRFGQNFLVAPGIIGAIVSALNPARTDTVVEIGPGLGALTEPLLERLDHLHVVEIDRDIVARLARSYPPERLRIHAGDALEFDFASNPMKVMLTNSQEARWMGKSDKPVCWYFTGIVAGYGSAISGEALTAREVACAATGAPKCVFELIRPGK